ncbi:MAG: RNA-directed DNA polymerase [Candidatus Riflebacteria bacterium]|nr:RNA-directed DNA polymerase [Candidatus Riflebacteria bacterium]
MTQAELRAGPADTDAGACASPFLEFVRREFTLAVWARWVKRRRGGTVPQGLDHLSQAKWVAGFPGFREEMLKDLEAGTFRFRFFRRITLAGGEKARRLCIPSVHDRLLMLLLTRYLRQAWGMRAGARVRPCSREIQKAIARERQGFFLKTDIQAFFDSVDHGLLLEKIDSKGDPILGAVVRSLLGTPALTMEEVWQARIDHGGQVWRGEVERRSRAERTARGLPQGLPCSTPLAEIFLLDFDREAAALPGLRMFRFVDDLLFLGGGPAELERARGFLARAGQRLRLVFAPGKTREGKVADGFDFLGFLHRPGYCARSERAVALFKRKWIRALVDPVAFLRRRVPRELAFPVQVLGCQGTRPAREILFRLVVQTYNVSILGWSREWLPGTSLFRMVLAGLPPEKRPPEGLTRADFAEVAAELHAMGRGAGGGIMGTATHNAFCTDGAQIAALNHWAGKLFASYARQLGLPPPPLVDHLKWFFRYRRNRPGVRAKALACLLEVLADRWAVRDRLRSLAEHWGLQESGGGDCPS